MATAKRGGAKAQAAQPAEPRHYLTPTELRERAAAVREKHSYDGKLTNAMLLDLEPLLNEPIDPRYIQTIPPTKGKPYESTGIRTIQVQVDRLNAVLGMAHWTKLLHYTDGGVVCEATVLVGNNLSACWLDEQGKLFVGDDAEVLACRSGSGGHTHGSNRGDQRKGAETNSLKRPIAQLGPGHDVYCLDFDEDVNPSDREPRAAEGDAKGGGQAAGGQGADPVTALAAALEGDDDLAALRREVDEGMRLFGLSPEDRLERLQSNATEEDLRALQSRISIALDERDSQLSIDGDK